MLRQKLYLVDGSAQLHRAYFAIRGLSTSRGMPTNATYGFTTMLRKLLEDEAPRWIAIAFDVKKRTFRHEQYAGYKANRPRMADDLSVQVPYVRRVCEAYRLPVVEVEGFEADDVIATLARQAVRLDRDVVVVSGDKDLLQLVGDRISVLNPGREGSGSTLYDPKLVESKFGVPPGRVVDVMALMGDPVDNVPGVAGIGDKGARDLILQFGSLEAALDGAAQVKRKSYRDGLLRDREQALLSKQLVTLRSDAPIELDLAAFERREPDREAAYALFSELEFQAIAEEFAPEATSAEVETETLIEPGAIAAAVAAAREAGRVSVRLVTTAGHPLAVSVLGAALSWRPGRAVYVPVHHEGLGAPGADVQARALEALRPLLEDPGVGKLSARAKRDRIALAGCGVAYAGLAFDAVVGSYLLNPGRRTYSLEELSLEFLGERRVGVEDVDPDRTAPVDQSARSAGADAELILRLSEPVLARLRDEGLLPILEEMELPLIEVLAEMERAGVKLDVELLSRMSADMEGQLVELTARIHELGKGEFNVNSPAQLREVLFGRLGLKSGKKTAKTRAASTAEDVLEELARVHELPRLILEYRGIQKLKSTYVDALPGLVRPETGRVHASFNQTVAATGRISSSDPNVQNIPIRTPLGRRIREAFVAEPGHLLLSADYSQIELRILAHLSRDETLIETFRRGEDVHDRTAREVFGPLSPIPDAEQRRISKMINYALIYGKTAFTLARDIGVTRREAESFIEAYFARYPRVREFIEETKAQARETLSVRTLLGRLRRLPDIGARNFQVRAEAERQAVNAPVQGSAADLIKKAMVDLHRELTRRELAVRLVLQIHDELLLEVREECAEEVRDLVRGVMEGALELDVPLVADAHLGRTWAEVH
jgi:DNA polymerase-1